MAEALWRETLINPAIFRDWIINFGRREAPQRMAHFFLEMKRRLAVIGHDDESFSLAMTQTDLADALGLSTVHVNRTLQALRANGVIEFRNGEVTIRDIARLAALGDFDGLYLHESPNFE